MNTVEAIALTPEAERALIDDALGGDQRAMRTLIARISRTVVHEAARSLFRMQTFGGGGGYSLSVEDLRQEILVLLFDDNARHLRAFDPQLGALSTYVGRIARNRLASYLQRQGGTGRAEVPTDEIVATSKIVSPQARHILIKLLEALRAELSETMWRTFIAVFVEERTAKEAAQVLGTSATAVHLRVWKIRGKARARLRALLAIEARDRSTSDEILMWLGKLVNQREDA